MHKVIYKEKPTVIYKYIIQITIGIHLYGLRLVFWPSVLPSINGSVPSLCVSILFIYI